MITTKISEWIVIVAGGWLIGAEFYLLATAFDPAINITALSAVIGALGAAYGSWIINKI